MTEWPSPPPLFSMAMKRTGSSRTEARLLAGIAAEVERHLNRDGAGRAAIAALERLGLAVVVTVDAVAGSAPVAVRLPSRVAGVPEWSQDDEQILRSLGIAGESEERDEHSTSKPGGRQQG